jgi:hypothetical protein
MSVSRAGCGSSLAQRTDDAVEMKKAAAGLKSATAFLLKMATTRRQPGSRILGSFGLG